MENCMLFRHTADGLNTGVDTAHELLAQADLSAFVPGVRFGNVLLGLWGSDQFNGHNDFVPFV
jgi:hypothetical protein